ncbi:hypothetical protein [Kineosporia sp. NBRC 101731]|uniref:hypothetical protein n=1 Tax=Kineosporia sp. NBRC 101731 TaxID=3032199 RepID=UPI0024A09D27|nr:hypothetical protein [Kineosporia sp. NBRC 101731]GLY29691.1 hypothetical protein Kisp02_30560 [Kineosporia sp. NBRC 101731]
MNEDDQHGEGRPPTYTPWLVVRAFAADDGSRPLPGGLPFWASPDIAAQPADAWGRVRAGDPVVVSVTVQNLGLAPASGVRARFWWCDPGLGSISPSTATVIGTSDRVSIPGGLSDVLACTTAWVPQFLNGGHECLVVEVSCAADPLTTSFRPDRDRHVGQRNVTVVAADGQAPPLRVLLANPFPERALATLHVRSREVFGAAALLKVPLHVSPVDALMNLDDPVVSSVTAGLGLETPSVPGDAVVRVGGVEPVEVGTRALDEEAAAALRQRAGEYDFGFAVAETVLEGGAAAVVELEVTRLGTADSAVVHHLTQVVDGVDVGGYTVVAPPL